MKITSLFTPLVAATFLVGCRATSPSQPSWQANVDAVPSAQSPPASVPQHLTEADAIALVKPLLPLPKGDSYRARFIEDASKVYAPGQVQVRWGAIWWVYTDRADVQYRSWNVVVIQDSDGTVLGLEGHL